MTLKQTGRLVAGKLEIQFSSSENPIRIVEQISGVIEEGNLLLDGISADVRQPNGKAENNSEFHLDSFTLSLSGDGRKLVGFHECDLGKGDAVFVTDLSQSDSDPRANSNPGREDR